MISPTDTSASEPPEPNLHDRALAALRTVIDPEVGLNLLDLGLIYSVEAEADRLRVAMTLTTPSCPMGAALCDGVEAALRALPGVATVELSLVWEPPWNPDMISAEGRAQLNGGRLEPEA